MVVSREDAGHHHSKTCLSRPEHGDRSHDGRIQQSSEGGKGGAPGTQRCAQYGVMLARVTRGSAAISRIRAFIGDVMRLWLTPRFL
jgi:hypothetical protein